MPRPLLLAAARILRVQPPRTPNEWARECRILPPGNAEPGPFNPDRTPYTNPISDAIASGKYRRVTMVMGTQQGKTDMALNTVGMRLEDDPVPMMFVAANKKLCESISRDRFIKMIKSSKSLSKKIAAGGLDNLTGEGGLRRSIAVHVGDLAS